MKRSTWNTAAILFLFSIALVGCGTTAYIEKDDSIDFGKYKTFAWVTASGNETHTSLAQRQIKDAVNKELEKSAGWREDKKDPDVLIGYDVLVERSSRVQNDAVYSQPMVRTFFNPRQRRYFNVYYPSQFMGYDNYSVPTREGTVTISMVDAKSDETVWQGWTTNEINSSKMNTNEVQAAVRSIFRKFDIAKK